MILATLCLGTFTVILALLMPRMRAMTEDEMRGRIGRSDRGQLLRRQFLAAPGYLASLAMATVAGVIVTVDPEPSTVPKIFLAGAALGWLLAGVASFVAATIGRPGALLLPVAREPHVRADVFGR